MDMVPMELDGADEVRRFGVVGRCCTCYLGQGRGMLMLVALMCRMMCVIQSIHPIHVSQWVWAVYILSVGPDI